MGFTESPSCTEVNDVPFTRDCIRYRDLSKRVYQPDLGQSPSANHRHAVGARTAHGHRALRQMGRGQEENFSLYHHVLNRARWSALPFSRLLLQALIEAFVRVNGSLSFVMDEPLERRWGPTIRKRGPFRDAVLSSRKKSGSHPGLRWIVLAWGGTAPWPQRCPSWPVLAV